MLYMVKGYMHNVMKTAKVYKNYEHIISDIIDIDGELYANFEDNELPLNAYAPKIKSWCMDNQGYSTDFSYMFDNGVRFDIGEIVIEDA